MHRARDSGAFKIHQSPHAVPLLYGDSGISWWLWNQVGDFPSPEWRVYASACFDGETIMMIIWLVLGSMLFLIRVGISVTVLYVWGCLGLNWLKWLKWLLNVCARKYRWRTGFGYFDIWEIASSGLLEIEIRIIRFRIRFVVSDCRRWVEQYCKTLTQETTKLNDSANTFLISTSYIYT